MPTTNPDPNVEQRDAERVDSALEALANGDLDRAESLLTEVVRNAPKEYVYQEERDGALCIKFWDMQEFVHYVTWQKDKGVEQSVNWFPSAYPRAYYYLGFLKVKTQSFEQALSFLERGCALEPTNPKFNFERGQALIGMGRPLEALQLYDEINTVGPHTSGRDIAIALRGRGFILIEMGQLDEAELALKKSLALEPDSEVALEELQCIELIRSGGHVTQAKPVATSTPDMRDCAACGRQVADGYVVNVDGGAVMICRKCHGKLTKKWWQFWK